MAEYHVGEEVEVNINALHHTEGSRTGLSTDPDAPPVWTAAVIERVIAFPGAEGFEDYAIRITGEILHGAAGKVGAESLRHPPRRR